MSFLLNRSLPRDRLDSPPSWRPCDACPFFPFQTLRHWLTIPLPERVEDFGHDALAVDLDTNRSQQAANAIGMVRPFAAELIELTVEMPLIFVSGIWDADCAPHVRLTFAVANEKSDQAYSVQAVRLGTPGSTIHLDTRRVDDHIVDTVVWRKRSSQKPSRPAS